jgi:hypothetical protein
MPTFRMLPAVLPSHQTRIANGRTYSALTGVALDVADCDAEILSANHWTKIELSGPTVSRPSSLTGGSPPYQATSGMKFLDTTLMQIIAAAVTNGATTTASPTISIASVPAAVAAGMSVFDVTNGNAIGTVLSTTSTTVTLTANAAHAVSSGDALTFSIGGVMIVFDGLTWRNISGVAA